MSRFIDLHAHTTFSDGTKTPFQLVNHAKHVGLSAVAITDHDTVKGVGEALKAGEEIGLEVVPGVEMDVECDTEMHILGYYIDYNSPVLNRILEELNANRMQRNVELIKKLNALGIDISIDDVLNEAKGEVVGRLHIAKAMAARRFVATVDEAFKKYLRHDKPAYVEKQRLSPQQGIEIIKNAKGVPVLAHPLLIGLNFEQLNLLVCELKTYGLMGIETYYVTHTRQEIQKLSELALKYDLLVTGGSDFHGDNKSDIEIGIGFGNLRVYYELLEKLKQKAKSM